MMTSKLHANGAALVLLTTAFSRSGVPQEEKKNKRPDNSSGCIGAGMIKRFFACNAETYQTGIIQVQIPYPFKIFGIEVG